jgi:hypothetical protein
VGMEEGEVYLMYLALLMVGVFLPFCLWKSQMMGYMDLIYSYLVHRKNFFKGGWGKDFKRMDKITYLPEIQKIR